MKKSIFVLVLLAAVSSSSLAWCETKVFQLGFTIPATVAFNTPKSSPTQPTDQISQTQQLLRDNRMISVTSIVAP